jgi:hypothetical protein
MIARTDAMSVDEILSGEGRPVAPVELPSVGGRPSSCSYYVPEPITSIERQAFSYHLREIVIARLKREVFVMLLTSIEQDLASLAGAPAREVPDRVEK